MGKPTGFMEYPRELPMAEAPAARVRHWQEFHEHADAEEPVESHPEASVGPGLQLACEGRSYGYGFGGEFGQVIVIISDMPAKIKPALSGRPCENQVRAVWKAPSTMSAWMPTVSSSFRA